MLHAQRRDSTLHCSTSALGRRSELVCADACLLGVPTQHVVRAQVDVRPRVVSDQALAYQRSAVATTTTTTMTTTTSVTAVARRRVLLSHRRRHRPQPRQH